MVNPALTLTLTPKGNT